MQGQKDVERLGREVRRLQGVKEQELAKRRDARAQKQADVDRQTQLEMLLYP